MPEQATRQAEPPTAAAATDNVPQSFVHRSDAEAAFAQVPKEERGGSRCPPKMAQSQPAEAKLSTDIPGDLSIPPFLRREQPKPQQPADATKPIGSLPPQNDEPAQDDRHCRATAVWEPGATGSERRHRRAIPGQSEHDAGDT